MSIQFKPTTENERRYEEATRYYGQCLKSKFLEEAKECLEIMIYLDKEFAGLGEP